VSGASRQKGGRLSNSRLQGQSSVLDTQTQEFAFKGEVDMYLTDIVWWGYTAFVVALALFMLFFAYKVREKED
jgi:hypothetical protein